MQRISRLTPQGAILALIKSHVGAVEPRHCDLAMALGRTLAADIAVSEQPAHPIALRDGYAVAAAAIADAGPYAPIPFRALPCRVGSGEPMPAGTDSVAPFDAVAVRGDRAEAVAAVSPGEGVLAAGGDATAAAPLRRAGERLRVLDIAVAGAAGVGEVTIRSPRLRIARGGATETPLIEATLAALTRLAATAGATAVGDVCSLDVALGDDQIDAVIAVGGTGSGRNDTGVRTLARRGRVAAHGIAISPGETTAFGFAGGRPVLLIPGRLDAAIAVWHLIGRDLLAQLAGGDSDELPVTMRLKRKVSSTIGMTELIPVRCRGGMAEALASNYLSFAALTRSDGFIVVPAGHEGYAADALVAVMPWP